MPVAITRDVSPSIDRCQLTHVARQPIDVDLARAQHGAYERCLRDLGCTVHRLPAASDLPDCVFVEDCAVVLDELAIIARPGASSRRPETVAVEEALAPLTRLTRIRAPATLDGGDVLRTGRWLFVGVSSRTTPAAVEQLRDATAAAGYTVAAVGLRGCLHLKSAATEVAPGVLLVNREWIVGDPFRAFACIDIDPSEPFAANALRIGNTVLYSSAYPRTRGRLEARGIAVHGVDVSELAKAEGAVTCCSLIVAPRSAD